MVEIRKIEAGRLDLDSNPLAQYMLNNPELALVHFLEEGVQSGQIESPFPLPELIHRIQSDGIIARCLLSFHEGYIAEYVEPFVEIES